MSSSWGPRSNRQHNMHMTSTLGELTIWRTLHENMIHETHSQCRNIHCQEPGTRGGVSIRPDPFPGWQGTAGSWTRTTEPLVLPHIPVYLLQPTAQQPVNRTLLLAKDLYFHHHSIPFHFWFSLVFEWGDIGRHLSLSTPKKSSTFQDVQRRPSLGVSSQKENPSTIRKLRTRSKNPPSPSQRLRNWHVRTGSAENLSGFGWILSRFGWILNGFGRIPSGSGWTLGGSAWMDDLAVSEANMTTNRKWPSSTFSTSKIWLQNRWI